MRKIILAAALLFIGLGIAAQSYVHVTYTVRRPDGSIPTSMPGATLKVTSSQSGMPAYVPGPQSAQYDAATGVLTWTVPANCQVAVTIPLMNVSGTYDVGALDVSLNYLIPVDQPVTRPEWAANLATLFQGGLALPLGGNLQFNQLENAQTAPTATATGSGVLTGDYWYSVIYLDVQGHHTALWSISDKVSPSSQQVELTNIPIGPAGTVSRQIYRTTVAEAAGYHSEYQRLLTTLQDNTTTTFTDNIPDASIAGNAQVPVYNNTGGQWILNGSPYLTLGDGSISIGPNAGYGQQSINIGSGTGGHGQPGTQHQSVNVGTNAGHEDLGGAGNVCIGSGAGYSNYYAGHNTYVGLNAGYFNLGGNNLFLGYAAGQGMGGTYEVNNTFLVSVNGQDLMRGSFDPSGKWLTVYGALSTTGNLNVAGTLTAGGETFPQDLTPYGRLDADNNWAGLQTFSGGVFIGGQQTTDAEAADTVIAGQAAYPHAVAYPVGGDLILSGGQGKQTITVTDYTAMYGSVITIYLNLDLPTAATYSLTEGVQWSAETSNNATAANLAAACNAWVPGMHAEADGAVISITQTPGTSSLAVVSSPAGIVDINNAAPGTGYLAGTWKVRRGIFQIGGEWGYEWPALPWSPGPAQTTIDAIGASFRDVDAPTGWAVSGIEGGIPGKILFLTFEQAGVTISDAGPSGWINLNGNYSSTEGSTLQLVFTGTQWREICRSLN